MGIQAWRLRRSVSEIQSDAATPEVDPDASVQAVDQVSSALPKVSTQAEERIAPTIWPSADKKVSTAKDKKVEFSTQKKESPQAKQNKVTPKPMPMPKPLPAPVSSLTPKPAPVLPTTPLDVPSDSEWTSVDSNALRASNVSDSVPKNTGPLDGASWQDLQALVDGWQHCPTCGDNKSLLGHGSVNADWLFVSDAPTSLEIEQQSLFAGRAGLLFDAMLNAIGLDRQQVYATSLFKCVASDDMSVIPACDTILQRQIQLLNPKVVVTFGEFTAQTMLKANANLDVLRTQDQHCINSKVVVVPTYTPAQMLDDARLKSKVWADLKKAILVANMPS